MRNPVGAVPAKRPWRPLAVLRCIRYREVLVLQGAPFLGVAFSLGRLPSHAAIDLAVFAVASYLLVAYVFALNDWAGAAADGKDRQKAAQVFLARGVSEASLMGLAGTFVFSWTDDWHTGGHPIEDWAFGPALRRQSSEILVSFGI